MDSKSKTYLKVAEKNSETQKNSSKITTGNSKVYYAFCIISITYFVGRCIASWWFNV
jgi:hypothetical protein